MINIVSMRLRNEHPENTLSGNREQGNAMQQQTEMDIQVGNGRGGLVPARSLAHLAMGTMVTRDLARARRRYESFFGLECVVHAPGRMICRDRRARHLMQTDARDFFLLDVRQVADIANPQAMSNHWGFSVASEAEVDRIQQEAERRADELGFAKVHPAMKIHGSYSSYMFDEDGNWWEVEYRRGITNDFLFSRGDWNAETRNEDADAGRPLTIAHTAPAVVGDEAFMTHGTSSVIDCNEARAFYEQVLNLRTVWHVRPSHCFGGGGDFGVIGITSGKRLQDQTQDNRFVLLLDDDAALRAAHARVTAAQADHGLLALTDIEAGEDGGQRFLLRTRDQVWFELSSRPRDGLRALFARS